MNYKDKLNDELDFWRWWISNRGGNYSDDFNYRMDPNSEIYESIAKYIDSTKEYIHILDVAAGPLTWIGKHLGNSNIKITPIDLLADEYKKILNEFGIKPLIETLQLSANKLKFVYPENSFDFINCQNCIDHMEDPLNALKNMIFVLKKDCVLYTRHREYEGRGGGYIGIHGWDIHIENENLFITNKKATIQHNLTEIFERKTTVSVEKRGDQIYAIFRKK